MNDVGDRTPGDSGDVAPNSPLSGLPSPTAVVSDRTPRKISYPKLPDFDPNLRVAKRVERQKDFWWSTILDADQPIDFVSNDNIYYEVLLSTGEVVLAYYPGQTIADKWDDFQRVQVTKDRDEYVIMTPPRGKALYLWWEAIELLEPGLSAKGKILSYNEDDEEYKDNGGTVSLTDKEHRNFVIPGEKIQVRIVNDQEYEPIGSFGIFRRKGKTKVEITPNGSGLVTIYHKSPAVIAKKPDAEGNLSVDIEVTANLNWAHGNKKFGSTKNVFITYFTDEKKWVIDGGEC